jgi:hypothetical protein
LPVALHLREAHSDGLAILKEIGMPPAGTLLHCFNLDYATLEPFLELGCLVAFGGPLTFKKSDEARDAARRTPQSKIVTETDAPFMAPHPVRGVTCGPEHVIYTAARLAETLNEDFDAAKASSETPSGAPSETPSGAPSETPSGAPSAAPSETPSKAPSETFAKSAAKPSAEAPILDTAKTLALYEQLFQNANQFFALKQQSGNPF